ncbi:hypothetical protein CK203_071221 [Vitis vinifera]|uniref:Uncharacterized protein n=1 Tax=Vitis vinifera TaxID=29760 RepID=A0A438DS54_VITVI|nr:hypothetical protein CK203_071221 [Vitis vinifera]
MVNAQRRRNILAKLRVDGEFLIKEGNVIEGVANAFSMILAELGEWRSSISGLTFNSSPNVDSQALKIPFSKEKVLATLYSLSGDKAPNWMASPWHSGSFIGFL